MQPILQSFENHFIPHLKLFLLQFGWHFIIFGLFGFVLLFVKRVRFGVYLLLMVLTNIFLAIRYDIINIEDYYIPSFLIFAVFIGYSLYSLLSLLSNLIPKTYFIIPQTLVCGLFLFFPIFQCKANYYSSDHADHYIAYDHGRNLLKHVKERAIVFLEAEEDVFPFWYLYYIENAKSKSVPIITLFLWKEQLLLEKPYANQIKEKYPDVDLTIFYKGKEISQKDFKRIKVEEILKNNPTQRSIYLLFDKQLSNRYTLIPEGVLWRISAEKLSDKQLIEYMDRNEQGFNLIRRILKLLKRNDEKYIQSLIISKYADFHGHLGVVYFEKGLKDKAIKEFETILKLEPNNIQAKQNLAILKKSQ
ncbi:MAG: hypothetical protein AB1630_09220 [bacterium]